MANEIVEVSVRVDPEAAEAVCELFNRYNGGGYDEENEAGQAGGGGAIIEATGFDDFEQPIAGEHQIVVKTYLKPGKRGRDIRRQIEEGLWRLSLLYPMPEPEIRILREEDWAHAWKKFYKPIRVGRRVLLKPRWEEIEAKPDDLVVELEPGMAFGTGMHPTTQLCITALELSVKPGDHVLDVGTGSGILAVVAAKLGASSVLATDIDPLAVAACAENLSLNGLDGSQPPIEVQEASVPSDVAGQYNIMVVNILAEVIVKLLDGAYDNVPLLEPLHPDGLLILSGIIDTREELVMEASVRHGLTLRNRYQEEDWLALVLSR